MSDFYRIVRDDPRKRFGYLICARYQHIPVDYRFTHWGAERALRKWNRLHLKTEQEIRNER